MSEKVSLGLGEAKPSVTASTTILIRYKDRRGRRPWNVNKKTLATVQLGPLSHTKCKARTRFPEKFFSLACKFFPFSNNDID
jgi:hypothetical protein